MAKTARQVIERAYRLAGVISHHRAMSATEGANGLEAFKSMLEKWGADGLSVPTSVEQIHTLTSGVGEYSWGVGGDLNDTAPDTLDSAWIREGGHDYPLTPRTRAQYAAITDKQARGRPRWIHWQPSWPLVSVQFYPIPDLAYTLHADVLGPIVQPSIIGDEVQFSGVVVTACEYNLALLLAGEHRTKISPLVLREAKDSRNTMDRKHLAQRVRKRRLPPGLTLRCNRSSEDFYG